MKFVALKAWLKFQYHIRIVTWLQWNDMLRAYEIWLRGSNCALWAVQFCLDLLKSWSLLSQI